MKTKALIAAAVIFAACTAANYGAPAGLILIDFAGIPPTYTPVNQLVLPGVALGGAWVADDTCSSCFENISDRAISAFPDGGAVLTIDFDAAVSNVRMDLGSSLMGAPLTILVSGFYRGQPMFSQTFTTHTVDGGADEVRAQTTGVVDQVTVRRAAGAEHVILDNLAFSTLSPGDQDDDGVPDNLDQCPDTPAGAAVNARGCGIEQLTPCSGPRPGTKWRNHGEYVKSVVSIANTFWRRGLITFSERNTIIRAAAKSNCGKTKAPVVDAAKSRYIGRPRQ